MLNNEYKSFKTRKHLKHESTVMVFAAELRWSSLNLEDKWHPPGRAGHSAIACPLDPQLPPLTVVFGGYNGHDCFNDVIVFDSGKPKLEF